MKSVQPCPTSVQPRFCRIPVLHWDVQPVQPISIQKVVLVKTGVEGVKQGVRGRFWKLL